MNTKSGKNQHAILRLTCAANGTCDIERDRCLKYLLDPTALYLGSEEDFGEPSVEYEIKNFARKWEQ